MVTVVALSNVMRNAAIDARVKDIVAAKRSNGGRVPCGMMERAVLELRQVNVEATARQIKHKV